MNFKRSSWLLFLPLMFSTLSAEENPDLKSLFQKALFAEEADQDDEAAAELYQEIVEAYDNERSIAAASFYRLGNLMLENNLKDEGEQLLTRLISEFPQSNKHSIKARQQLEAMGRSFAPSTTDSELLVTTEEKQKLIQLKQLALKSPDLVTGRAGQVPPLREAAEKGWLTIIEWLVDEKLVSERYITACLPTAVSNGHLGAAELLISKGAKLDDAKMPNALISAIDKKYIRTVNFMIDQGVPINQFGYLPCSKYIIQTTPLGAASWIGNTDLINKLIASDADPNKHKTVAPLHLACMGGNLESVQTLLEQQAEPSIQDKDNNNSKNLEFRKAASCHTFQPGWTPLHYAVAYKTFSNSADTLEIIEALLTAKATVNALDSIGKSPLHLAVIWRDKSVIEFLIKHGADINLPDKKGQTPLLQTLTATTIESEKVDFLINKGADVNMTMYNGTSALHLATEHFNVQIVKRLLDAGAQDKSRRITSINWQDIERTALDEVLARMTSKVRLDKTMVELFHKNLESAQAAGLEIVSMLTQKGAKIPYQLNHSNWSTGWGMSSEIRAKLTTLTYPDLANQKAIFATLPDAGTIIELAKNSKVNQKPPKLTKEFAWKNLSSNSIRPDYKSAVIHRINNGKSEKIPVDFSKETNLPTLLWGDVLEFSPLVSK